MRAVITVIGYDRVGLIAGKRSCGAVRTVMVFFYYLHDFAAGFVRYITIIIYYP